ncbi:MAG: hypothetical protein ACLT4W_07065 [Campylobacter upsaliensis]
MKNVILLGGSNSVVQNGLQKGLKDTLMSCGGGDFIILLWVAVLVRKKLLLFLKIKKCFKMPI